MKNIFSIFVCIIFIAGCKKPETGNNKNICPPELQGKWVRGEFNMAGFAAYQGTTIMDAALTTGAFEFLAGGEVKAYSVSFPTDAQAGCNPQLLQLYSGTADHTVTGKVVLHFTAGTERKFYQQCAGKTNTQRVLTANDFNGALTCYWSIETGSGKTLLAIRYDLPGNPKLYFEKKNW
nr:hypothetical protein [uncultured Lacibacter sp.]